jgi:hypothetical protein
MTALLPNRRYAIGHRARTGAYAQLRYDTNRSKLTREERRRASGDSARPSEPVERTCPKRSTPTETSTVRRPKGQWDEQ